MMENKLGSVNLPDDHQYLWRYTNMRWLKIFLQGNLSFSPISSFNDYYEAIDPELYYLHTILNNGYALGKNTGGWSSISILNSVSNPLERMNLFYSAARLKEYWNVSEEDFDRVLGERLTLMPTSISNHRKIQQGIHCSCWFLSELPIENWLMWKTYSKPGGLAVRLRFKEFKMLVESMGFSEEENAPSENYTTFQMGKVKYPMFLDSNWIDEYKKGTPLFFMKHYSFENENEFRVCTTNEVKKENPEWLNFKFLNLLLFDTIQIVLHPASSKEQFDRIQDLLKESNLRGSVHFSDLRYNLSKNEIQSYLETLTE